MKVLVMHLINFQYKRKISVFCRTKCPTWKLSWTPEVHLLLPVLVTDQVKRKMTKKKFCRKKKSLLQEIRWTLLDNQISRHFILITFKSQSNKCFGGEQPADLSIFFKEYCHQAKCLSAVRLGLIDVSSGVCNGNTR